MIQTIMFDMKGKPTELAMRYVVPRYYSVDTDNGMMRYFTYDVHEAIGMWLKDIDSKIVTHW
jgi:hypothetical protein